VWQFDFGDGKAVIRPSDAEPPDFEWTIQQFSQLFIGHADPVALARQGLFAAPTPGKANAVRDAFFDAPPHLMDFF